MLNRLPPGVDLLIGTTLQVGQQLHPAVAVLTVMYTLYQQIELNRQKIGGLLNRCRGVIGSIDERLQHYSPTENEVKQSVAQLIGHLHFIEMFMQSLTDLSPIKTLLRRDEIMSQINHCHQRLSDCLALFNVSAALDLQNYLEGLERARVEDEEYLKQELQIIKANDTLILQHLGVLSNQMEAMTALQFNLAKKIDQSVEREVLQDTLGSLERRTGTVLVKKPHSWTITSFDVDIDHQQILGNGAFSTVKSGKWGKSEVAVKEMKHMTDSSALLREIKIWKRLRHTHVLQFYGASLNADPPFIVSRYMKNGNIAYYLTVTRKDANRVKLIHEVALGMLYLHSQNVVHGDLKTANVLISDSGEACITDFGMSVIKQHVTSFQTQPIPDPPPAMPGRENLRYMSPEAMLGNFTRGGDVWSFAMTIYEILTDTPPFGNVSHDVFYAVVIRKRVRLQEPTDPIAKSRGLNQTMWSLIHTASDYDPAGRPKFQMISGITELLLIDWTRIAGKSEVATTTSASSYQASQTLNSNSDRQSPSSTSSSRATTLCESQPPSILQEIGSPKLPVVTEPRQITFPVPDTSASSCQASPTLGSNSDRRSPSNTNSFGAITLRESQPTSILQEVASLKLPIAKEPRQITTSRSMFAPSEAAQIHSTPKLKAAGSKRSLQLCGIRLAIPSFLTLILGTRRRNEGIRRTVAVVGTCHSGKTALALRCAGLTNADHSGKQTRRGKQYTSCRRVNGEDVDLCVLEVSGEEPRDWIRAIEDFKPQVILLCFDARNIQSLADTGLYHLVQVSQAYSEARLALVGCEQISASRHSPLIEEKGATDGTCVLYRDGVTAAAQIGAEIYLECNPDDLSSVDSTMNWVMGRTSRKTSLGTTISS